VTGPDPDYYAAVMEGTPGAAPRDTVAAFRRSYTDAREAGYDGTRSAWAGLVIGAPQLFALGIPEGAELWAAARTRREQHES
jgi:hypothetical protein